MGHISMTFTLGDLITLFTIVAFGLKAHSELVEIRLKVKTLWDKYIRDHQPVED